jgi:hypothetical protein
VTFDRGRNPSDGGSADDRRGVSPGGPTRKTGVFNVTDLFLIHTYRWALDMSRRSADPVPLRLQRCADCGHPNEEHRGKAGCTVPRCRCSDYADQTMHPSKQNAPVKAMSV